MEEKSDQANADIEHHFTVLVRLPFKRGDFIDPPPVAWSAAKERELWNIISRPSKGNAIDWKSLADQFHVSQQFLLQQAAWLYERQLSQVRAQMRRVGTNQSNFPSPIPGSMSGSTLGIQAPRRTGSGSSRVPSRLSNRQRESSLATAEAEATTSSKLRSIGGTRNISTNTVSDLQKDKDVQRSLRPASKGPLPSNNQQEVDRPSSPTSPLQESSSEHSSSEEDNDQDRKLKSRRHQPPPYHRRGAQPRPQSFIRTSQSEDGDEDDDGGSDSAPFLPFAAAALPRSQSSTTRGQDPGATLRGDLRGSNRPTTIRRATSERLPPSTQRPQPILTSTDPPSDQHSGSHRQPLSTIDSSATSSSSSTNNTASRPSNAMISQNPTPQRQRQSSATALSPRQTAALNAAGLTSPRVHRRGNGGNGGNASDGTGTPSMGSSFSDLDDTSVTQSALEEALASNMQRQGGGTGGQGRSRMSTISQALRSRYL